MAALKIQINGSGMIPRGLGLAPRKELLRTGDFNFILLLLRTRGLTLKYLNPATDKLEDLTNKNAKSIWDKYSEYSPAVNAAPILDSPAQITKSTVGLGPVPPVEESNDTSITEQLKTEPTADDKTNVESESETANVEEPAEAPVQEIKLEGKPNNYQNSKNKNRH